MYKLYAEASLEVTKSTLFAMSFVKFKFSNFEKGSAVLLGISMGGRAIMWEALQNPDSVSSLIVLDAKGFQTDVQTFTRTNYCYSFSKPPFQVTPGSAVDGPYDVDEYFYEMAKIDKNWPTKDQLPMSKVRKWLDQHFRDLIPDDALRAYVLTNLNRKGESYRKGSDNIFLAWNQPTTTVV